MVPSFVSINLEEFITHAHPDHFFGYEVIKSEFPDAEYLAAPEVIAELKEIAPGKHGYWKPIYGDDLAEEYYVPSEFDADKIVLEGQVIDLLKLSAGESEHLVVVSVPSAQTIITGDLVYNGVHPWLAEATQSRRANWKESLLQLQRMDAKVIVAGHKSLTSNNSPKAISFMLKYLENFEVVVDQAENAESAIQMMKVKYPNLQLPIILEIAMKAEFARQE